ncbi:hypothetical protein J2046_000229 [Rhizobium petrolearium]|uniref:hypothetical protein n=1 Tax=Neorhizobium petrolearium TaxID=515361 RepID=UPI001AE456D2|nr:hypothetical protein [Neorhizobium petrolearium]MBP1841985.1 hypothetical protein [Neorhizobium petrolearium]
MKIIRDAKVLIGLLERGDLNREFSDTLHNTQKALAELVESEWFVGRYGLVIRNARPVTFIAVKGQLGFFEWRKMLEANHG